MIGNDGFKFFIVLFMFSGFMPKKVQCPACKTEVNLVRVIYGYPSQEAQKLAEKNEVVLGGCLVDERNPLYACSVCKTELPEYGTLKDMQEALGNKDTRETFRKKEIELIGKSFILSEEEISKFSHK